MTVTECLTKYRKVFFLKLTAFAAASEFYEWVQVGIDVYIPHRKYQVKPHSAGFQLLVLHPS